MTPYDLLRKASEMDVPKAEAIKCRLRYLHQQARYWGDLKGWGWYPEHKQKEALDEIAALNRLARRRDDDEVTEEMVAEAKGYPITSLIEFDRQGKARRSCPNDGSHSLDLVKRANVAKCFPCNQSWGPLAWTTKVMGMKFVEAVNYLRR